MPKKRTKICKNCEEVFEQNRPGRIYISRKTGKHEKRIWFCKDECLLSFLKKKQVVE